MCVPSDCILYHCFLQDDHDYYTTKGLTGQDSLQYWFDLSKLYQQGDTNVEYSSLVNRSRTVRVSLYWKPSVHIEIILVVKNSVK